MRQVILSTCLMLAMLAASSLLAAAAQLKMEQMQHHATDKDGDGKAEEHDTSFDHEMFLGKEGSQQFTGLQAQEAKEKLGGLFDAKIDADKSGKVTKEELVKWMQRVAEEHVQADLDGQWARLNKSAGQLVTWAEYTASKLPGALPNQDEKLVQSVLKVLQASDPAAIAKSGTVKFAPLPSDASEDTKSFLESLATDVVRESKRWLAADGDKDGKLSRSELHQFLYPDEFQHMRDVMVQESLEHADKNKDGKVSMDEFIADMWNPAKESEEKEPVWVADERTNFKDVKDKNKDGFLDRKEFADYMFSHQQEQEDLYKREAEHLISEADTDKDGALSRKEIVDSVELFAGSAATNYGDHIGLREDL